MNYLNNLYVPGGVDRAIADPTQETLERQLFAAFAAFYLAPDDDRWLQFEAIAARYRGIAKG